MGNAKNVQAEEDLHTGTVDEAISEENKAQLRKENE